MGKFYETIPEDVIPWVAKQNVFWVASAPLSAKGHVNVSPKGGRHFGVLDERRFWYCDLTGSGVETTSHLHEPGNGRITIMFNAFEGAPRILRFWGIGRVLEYGTSPFEQFIDEHKVSTIPGVRSIIIVDIHQVGTSCGFSVPFYDFNRFRPTLDQWAEKRVAADQLGDEKDGLERYWAYKNQLSIDNLPGLQRGVSNALRDNVEPMSKMVGPYAPSAPTSYHNNSKSSSSLKLMDTRSGKGKFVVGSWDEAAVMKVIIGFMGGILFMVLSNWIRGFGGRAGVVTGL